MSGGFFDWTQRHLDEIAYLVERQIQINNSEEVDYFGERIGRGYSKATIDIFKEACYYLVMAKTLVDRIDYLLEGDDSEETFHKRVKEDLQRLERSGLM